jgi:hypothetical protein
MPGQVKVGKMGRNKVPLIGVYFADRWVRLNKFILLVSPLPRQALGGNWFFRI